jgi:SAM-dependent methyltransferase
VLKHYPKAEAIGIDFGSWNSEHLNNIGVKPLSVNIETEKLPFGDESIDFIIANQEHTKEIFWINHEIFRCLKIGGYFYMGTPNLLSLHNRVLMAFGNHPTQHKLVSAHVRPFSKKDVFSFYSNIANSFSKIDGFWGSQFYPFPKMLARFLSSIMPSQSFSIFFLIKKTGKYHGEFIEWPRKATLESNFYVGDKQYS